MTSERFVSLVYHLAGTQWYEMVAGQYFSCDESIVYRSHSQAPYQKNCQS